MGVIFDDWAYLLESQFEVFNVLLQAGSFLFQLLLVLEELVAGIFLLLQTLLGVLFFVCLLLFYSLFGFFIWSRKKGGKFKKKGKNHQTIPAVGTLNQTWFSFSLKPATHNKNSHTHRHTHSEQNERRHNRQKVACVKPRLPKRLVYYYDYI